MAAENQAARRCRTPAMCSHTARVTCSVVALPPQATSTTQTGPTPEALAAIARKKSVLDHVIGEIGGLQKRVGSVDRARLDNHLTSLREVERVATMAPPTTATGATCMAPMTAP